jgi:hypothetical protein
LREYKFSAIAFVVALCFLLLAPLFASTSFPTNDLSKDILRENSEESILAAPDPFVTLTFTGTITEVGVHLPPPDVFSDVVVGDSWTLTYTFDVATRDVDGRPTAGQYRNPITDMTLKIGSTTVSGTPGQALPNWYSSLIGVNLGSGYADYTAMTGLPDTSAWAQVILDDEIGAPFADDSIPLSIPIPLEAKFPTSRQFLLRALGSTWICIKGTLEDIVYPPDYIINYMIDAVDGLVSSGVLKAGTSLTKKLESAIDLLNRDNHHAASKKLGDFIDQANALIRSGRLPMEDGQELISLAQKVIDLLTNT